MDVLLLFKTMHNTQFKCELTVPEQRDEVKLAAQLMA